MTDDSSRDIWKDDRLGYQAIGAAFTNLIKSIDDEKVISIEAGFGRGKTFFRKAWAQQLRAAGEVVIEVDVRLSDHSGDPVITLLGAMLEHLPREDVAKTKEALKKAKKIGQVAAKAGASILFKHATEDALNLLTDKAIDELGDFDALDGLLEDVGGEMSKAAAQLIATSMVAERIRKKELPDQLRTLREALTSSNEVNRVVVIIDELDRCHPDYALAFLEATKLMFDQTGFTFCLMVNADYLENLAKHRYGAAQGDEMYLDKFVDIRLGLASQPENLSAAVSDLVHELPPFTPFGEAEEFSSTAAAELAAKLAVASTCGMRKIKRILLKVELALRCYRDRPIDLPLLIYLAFEPHLPSKDWLNRAALTPEVLVQYNRGWEKLNSHPNRAIADKRHEFGPSELRKLGVPELTDLPDDRYRLPEKNKDYQAWAKVILFLAPHYIPEHEKMLNSIAAVMVPDE
ncbi:NTPase [Marivivens donghaensis]|uniref:NTPase n=1 Tax=Marivivens donghaensis TaxID=1699413 RepID=A0ABX0W1N0_9RHOB|nr:P-loop NTPase fold protein [Marivivens donghaensis]NIY73983.1 NTPase [Marivivens donghaensis]